MSTPPFVDAPEGVQVIAPPLAPAPLLLAPARGVPKPRGTVLLVPGFTGSKEDFVAVLLPLADRGWTVAAMDQPGQNGSPALGPRGSHSLETLSEVVDAVTDWLSPDEPIHLVGHSFGGLVTRTALISRPERYQTWTSLCSGPSALPEDRWPDLQALGAALGHLPMEVIWASLQADEVPQSPTPSPLVPAAAVSARVQDFLHRRFLANDPDALADLTMILQSAPDRTRELAALAKLPGGPRLAVVTGELDDAWPVEIQRSFAHALDAPWILMPGCGHSPAAQSPEATAQVLDSHFAISRRSGA